MLLYGLKVRTRNAPVYCRIGLAFLLSMVLMLTADAQGANIVFEGTVKQAGTSALPIVKASPRMVVAIVDKILEKPDSVNLAVGDTVTVELLDTTKLPVGAKHTFHTVGWIYGKSLAVREVPLTGAV